MWKCLLVVLSGIVGFAAPSSAETAAQVARRWGIVGSWQKDCNAPLGRGNTRQAYVVRNGDLFLDRDTGSNQDSNPILSARINVRGELELVVVFPAFKEKRLNVHARLPDGRDHMVLNRDVDTGQYSVKNGVLLSNGVPTPLTSRCD